MRHAALHARAQAFPLGLAVLAANGVTAWRNVLADLTGAPASSLTTPLATATPAAATRAAGSTAPAGGSALPAGLAGELIKVLAAMTLVPT